MSIDLAAALRRVKPDKFRAQLTPRSSGALTAAADVPAEGRPQILLDTNVYIHVAAGTLPAAARALVERALQYHCSICVAEIATGIANGNPAHPGWAVTRDYYEGLIATFSSSRLLLPDENIWAEAGLIAGTLARTQHFQPHQRKECLNDALIFLTAAKAGLPVLTENRADFDLIQQLAPQGHFIYY